MHNGGIRRLFLAVVPRGSLSNLRDARFASQRAIARRKPTGDVLMKAIRNVCSYLSELFESKIADRGNRIGRDLILCTPLRDVLHITNTCKASNLFAVVYRTDYEHISHFSSLFLSFSYCLFFSHISTYIYTLASVSRDDISCA